MGSIRLGGLPANDSPENKDKMTRKDLAARQLSEQLDFTKNLSDQLDAARSLQTAALLEGSVNHSNRYAGVGNDDSYD